MDDQLHEMLKAVDARLAAAADVEKKGGTDETKALYKKLDAYLSMHLPDRELGDVPNKFLVVKAALEDLHRQSPSQSRCIQLPCKRMWYCLVLIPCVFVTYVSGWRSCTATCTPTRGTSSLPGHSITQ
jgi:hypothetical protein